ncbi:MAG TPA: hypothetical protein VEX13_11805, partial [Chloroflexia bacterium]|nr:hypothetical protein [Chloroflexia bacterium]
LMTASASLPGDNDRKPTHAPQNKTTPTASSPTSQITIERNLFMRLQTTLSVPNEIELIEYTYTLPM